MKKVIITMFSSLMITVLFVMPSLAQHHANHHNGHHETESVERFNDVPEDFRALFTEAVETYITGKDAFVDSDLEETISEFETFIGKLEEIGEHGLSGDGHMAWMKSYSEMVDHAFSITASSDIEEARSAFRLLSEELIDAVIKFGIDGVVYKQFCPMALDSNGANWLSKNEQVQNPYTPETMLGCGMVIERIES